MTNILTLSSRAYRGLITEIEGALDTLKHYDDVRIERGDMDMHTDIVIVSVGRALHRAKLYFNDLREQDGFAGLYNRVDSDRRKSLEELRKTYSS